LLSFAEHHLPLIANLKEKVMDPMAEATPVVEMRNIKKNFAAVQALRGVDLVLNHNEVLGLVGDNAAGKSTLMKVLSGAYIPDEGEIFIEGQDAHLTDPLHARRLGIEMVYQDLALANNLDVTANVFMGRGGVSTKLGPFGIMDSRLAWNRKPNAAQPSQNDIPRYALLVRLSAASDSRWPSPGRPLSTPRSSSWTSPPRP
jgi:ABC-type sugar transport system ATPase subunit